MPVQKQTRAGQRTRFKAFVAIGDENGHIGLGVKCSKEVATAIRGAIILAKLSVVPVRRGYWGNKIGKPHTVPCKVISLKTQSNLPMFYNILNDEKFLVSFAVSTRELTLYDGFDNLNSISKISFFCLM